MNLFETEFELVSAKVDKAILQVGDMIMTEILYPIFPYKKIDKNSKCLIYGAGAVGKILLKQIEKSEFCHFIGFVDMNAKNLNKNDGDYIYICPEEICEYQYDYIIIGVLDNKGIQESLQILNIPFEKLVFLDESDYYREDEFKKVFNKIYCSNNFLPPYLKMRDIDLQESLSSFLERSDIKGIIQYKKDVFSDLDRGGVFMDDSLEIVIHKISKTDSDEIPVLEDNKLIKVIDKISFYAAIADIRESEDEPIIFNKNKKDYSKMSPMWERYGYNKYSQFGEDGIIEEIFKRIGFQSKYAVEFGAWDGIHLSNIKNLIEKYEFSALYIEGDKDKAAAGRANYAVLSDRVHFMTGFVQHRKDRLLNSFLDEDKAPIDIDILSIDVDGYDYYIWKSLSKYRPRCVIIEFNPTIPNHIVVIPPLRENASVGASAAALVELGVRKGYALVAVTAANLVFVVNEEFEKLNVEDNSLELLRPKEIQRENNWFMTYDGMIYNAGEENSYIWQNGKEFLSNRFTVHSANAED